MDNILLQDYLENLIDHLEHFVGIDEDCWRAANNFLYQFAKVGSPT